MDGAAAGGIEAEFRNSAVLNFQGRGGGNIHKQAARGRKAGEELARGIEKIEKIPCLTHSSSDVNSGIG